MPTSATRLLTPNELATLSGAVVAVFFATQSLRHVLGWNPKVVGLSASMIVAIAIAGSSADHSILAWIAAVANGFIIYATAAGLAGMSASIRRAPLRRQTERTPPVEEVRSGDRFFDPWYSE